MHVVFEQMTSDQMRQFLKFLYDSRVSYKFQSTQVDIIIKAIQENLVNPEWLSTPGMIGVMNILEKKDLSFVNIVKGFNDDDFNTLLAPNEHYKKYCGPEWLNSTGMTTKNSVIRFIEHNVLIQKMDEVDGQIFMNTWMKEFLNDYRATIYRKEIPNLVNRFF